MKKLVACLLALMLFCGILAPGAAAVGFEAPFDLAAPAAYVVNTDTNIIIYEKNSEEPFVAASLTKLMTVVLMLEQYQDQLDSVTCTAPRYIYDYLYGKNASTADIRSGNTVTMRQLLYAMMLPSANEAAYIVADSMGGGNISNFVALMNSEAAKIGCTNTVFTDPCGLDEGNRTTARDIYLILRYAMSFDAFNEVCKAESYDMAYPDRAGIIQNTNRMVCRNFGAEFYRSYTQGGKTGTLGDWQNFAGWHTQDGMTYISVVLHSPDSCDPYQYPTLRPALYETGVLMDWVFAGFSVQSALDVSQPITELPVKYSTVVDTLMLYPADPLSTILPVGTDGSTTQKTFDLPESVAAPIAAGDVVGTVTLSLSGEVIGTVDLVAAQDVARNPVLYTLAKVGEFFGSLYFRVVLILSALVFGVYLVLFGISAFQHRGQKRVRRRYYD